MRDRCDTAKRHYKLLRSQDERPFRGCRRVRPRNIRGLLVLSECFPKLSLRGRPRADILVSNRVPIGDLQRHGLDKLPVLECKLLWT